jgi:hypothetical protein
MSTNIKSPRKKCSRQWTWCPRSAHPWLPHSLPYNYVHNIFSGWQTWEAIQADYHIRAWHCLYHDFRKRYMYTLVCTRLLFNEINQLDATIYQVYYLTFMYSPTCFGRPCAHHQERNNCSSSLWFYRWNVVIAVLLVVVGPAGTTTTNSTAITTLQR